MAVFPLPSEAREDSADNALASNSHNHEQPHPQLCDTWRDIQGANSWNGLLDPINPTLKSEILRNGDLAQLCYDAFDGDNSSKYYGRCRHTKRALFEEMGMSGCGYKVTRYIHANTELLSSLFGEKAKEGGAWMGFVAVCDDPNEIRRLGRRDIVIAWRGTQTPLEWIQNLRDFLVPARLSHATSRTTSNLQQTPTSPHVRMERGFVSCYTSSVREDEEGKGISAGDTVIAEIKRLLQVYHEEIDRLGITVTGHSLGAALATICAYDIKQMAELKETQIPVTVFAFASPRVGNLAFAKRVEEVGVKVLRLVNPRDVVPKVPGVFMNEKMGWLGKLFRSLPWTYFHVGVKLSVPNNSPLLKHTHDLASFHSLEVYLHLLDGFCGSDGRFESAGRDPALVNKSSDLLVEKLEIPGQWWQQENKGLVKGSDGKWKQPTRSVDEEDEDF